MPTGFLSCNRLSDKIIRTRNAVITGAPATPEKPVLIGVTEGTLLVSFLSLFCFALLYVFRSFDANTLTSWRWVFQDGGFSGILPWLGLSVPLSLIISRTLPLERQPVPILIFTSALAVLPLWPMPEMLLDSGRYFLQAKYLAEFGPLAFLEQWGREISAWTDLPLIPFVYGLVLRAGDETRTAVQLLNTVVFILSVLLTFRIGTLLMSRETGMYGGLFLLGMPYLLSQVPQMLVDIHAMFFLLLATCCFLSALKTPTPVASLRASAVLTAAMLVKYSLWPMLAMLPAACLLVEPRDQWPVALKRGAYIILPAVVTLALMLFLQKELFFRQLNLLLTYQRPALGLWSEGILSSLLFQVHPFLLPLALFSGYRARQSKDRRYLFILLFCLLLIVLGIRRIRYMIPLLPFVALLAAYGLMSVKEVRLRRLTAALMVTTSLVILHGAYLPFFRTTSMMNIMEAGKLLNRINGTFALVTVLPQEKSEGSTFPAIALLDLYTDRTIISRQRWPMAQPPHLSPLSPLRFTWQLRKPPWYGPADQHGRFPGTRIRISSVADPEESVSKGADASKAPPYHFTGQTDVFRYRTLVTVLNP